jgi:hypothetical protein
MVHPWLALASSEFIQKAKNASGVSPGEFRREGVANHLSRRELAALGGKEVSWRESLK